MSEPPATKSEPSKYPGHVRRPYRTGRPADRSTEAVLEFCYDEHIINGRTRAQVLEMARIRFPDHDALTNPRYVKTYAERWARRFVPALPLDRGPDWRSERQRIGVSAQNSGGAQNSFVPICVLTTFLGLGYSCHCVVDEPT